MRCYFLALILLVSGTSYAENKTDKTPIPKKTSSKRIKISCQEWSRLTGETSLPCDAIPVLQVTQSQYRVALAKQDRQKCQTAARTKMAAAGKECPPPGVIHVISLWTGPEDPESKTVDCVAELNRCDEIFRKATSPPSKSKPKKQIKLF